MRKTFSVVFAMAVLVCGAWGSLAHAQGKTLRWSSQGDIATHDPQSQNESLNNSINIHIYEPLFTRDKNMKMVPSLATASKQTSPTVWEVTLRKGVKWHDGSGFTADDVVFSVVRAQQPTSNFKGYASPWVCPGN